MSASIAQPLKWHGGKSYLADRIIALMPPRCKNPNAPADDDSGWLHYVEPYFGGAAVLLANDPDRISEVVNDKNGELTNFWRTLQDPTSFELMRQRLDATFSHPEFVHASQLKEGVLGAGLDQYVPLDLGDRSRGTS